MAVSKKISELPVLISPDATDLLPVVDVVDGVTKQITIGSLLATAVQTRALVATDRMITPDGLAQTFYAIRLFLTTPTPTVQASTPQTSSWTIARNSTGVFTLTHSLDLTDQDLICWQITPDAAGQFYSCNNATKDTLVIHVATGDPPAFIDPAIDVMVLGFRFGE